MANVHIENPILNSPFAEPTRHFRFADDGITDQVIEGRRISHYFVPIAKAKKKGAKQREFETEWTQDRIKETKLVNDIRRRVALWRSGGHLGVTPTTARLLAYWTDPNREKRLFFCQIEALETAIYLTEVAGKYGDAWIENDLRQANDMSNPGLPRVAFKMATGSGKTVVMAMREDKCHLSHVVADTDSWEQKLAQALEDMPEVVRYVKNHNLGFTIPYTLNGDEKQYVPDFIACIDDDHGADDLLNLVIELTSEKKKDKAAKVATARTLWVPSINNDGSFGRWVFIEVADPWNAQSLIRQFVLGTQY